MKYFFGYQNWFGRVYPVMWVEDKGIAIGGVMRNIVEGTKVEISEKEFNGPQIIMVERHPQPTTPKDT